MTKYTQERNEHTLSLMAALHNKPVAEVMEQIGITAMLFLWRKQAVSEVVRFMAMGEIRSNGALPINFQPYWKQRRSVQRNWLSTVAVKGC